MNSALLVLLALLCIIKDLSAQFSFTENVPFHPYRGYQDQESFNYQSCSLATSGWSSWIPSSCTACGQSRYRYCQGAYNGCGEWYCLGNRVDYCRSTCPVVRPADPRVTVSPSRSNACGARVTFSCPECYLPSGSRVSECLPNSTWSHTTPSCSFVTCPEPYKQLLNGYVSWGANCQDQATYRCFYGYELLGPDKQRCNSEGYWEPPAPPICIPVKCPHLTRPQNGFLILLSRSFRARAYFGCRFGYRLHGSRSIRCSASGSWSPAPPACVSTNSSDFWGK